MYIYSCSIKCFMILLLKTFFWRAPWFLNNYHMSDFMLLLWLLMFYNNNYNNVLERTRHWLTSVYGTYLSLFTTCSTLAFIHLMPFKLFPPQRKSKSKLVKLINKLRASLKWIYSELCTHSSIYNSTGCFFSLNPNKRIGSSYDSQECFILLHVFFCVTKDQ